MVKGTVLEDRIRELLGIDRKLTSWERQLLRTHRKLVREECEKKFQKELDIYKVGSKRQFELKISRIRREVEGLKKTYPQTPPSSGIHYNEALEDVLKILKKERRFRMTDKIKEQKIENWGKDHWSTLAYAETLAVDGGKKGLIIPVRERMRTNEKTHPHLVGTYSGNMGGSKYPTRLKNGEIKGHDDWDCLFDMVKLGLLKDVGTGINPAFLLTKFGIELSQQLRFHKANGGNFSTFVPELKKGGGKG